LHSLFTTGCSSNKCKKALEELKKDGSYQKIFDKYLKIKYALQINSKPRSALVGVFIFLPAEFFDNYFLKYLL